MMQTAIRSSGVGKSNRVFKHQPLFLRGLTAKVKIQLVRIGRDVIDMQTDTHTLCPLTPSSTKLNEDSMSAKLC